MTWKMSTLGMILTKQREVLKDVIENVKDKEDWLIPPSSTEFEEKLKALALLIIYIEKAQYEL